MFDQGMTNMPNFGFDSSVVGNNNIVDNDMNVDINMMNYGSQNTTQMSMASPISEAVQEKQIHRTIVHEVPHVCPIHTRIINHHVYKHTYRPEYSCSEENTVSNVQCGSCCQFK